MLAFLGAQGMKLSEGIELISKGRPEAAFPRPYRLSVVRFVEQYRSQSSATEEE